MNSMDTFEERAKSFRTPRSKRAKKTKARTTTTKKPRATTKKAVAAPAPGRTNYWLDGLHDAEYDGGFCYSPDSPAYEPGPPSPANTKACWCPEWTGAPEASRQGL